MIYILVKADVTETSNLFIFVEVGAMVMVMQWSLWFCNLQIAGTNPVGDRQDHELFGEIALKNSTFFCICGVQNYLRSYSQNQLFYYEFF